MSQSAKPIIQFHLVHDGRQLTVETERAGWETVARLSIDGRQVAEKKNWLEAVTLKHEELTVKVKSTPFGQVTQVNLVPEKGDSVPFTPPAGSHAARLEKLANERPILYASRHLGLAILNLIVGIIAPGAILWGIVTWLLPDLDLPSITVPGWLESTWRAIERPIDAALAQLDRVTDPVVQPVIGWVESLIDWLPDWVGGLGFLIPIILALFVAFDEVEKRKKRRQERDQEASGKTSAGPKVAGPDQAERK